LNISEIYQLVKSMKESMMHMVHVITHEGIIQCFRVLNNPGSLTAIRF
jgi:hypothetical protein